jgi:two-component system LytT family sensor kinase
MFPSAQFWKKFYLIFIPFAAIIVYRDAFLDFYYLHRAGRFSITFQYNLLVWILWLAMSPCIAWLFLKTFSRPKRIQIPVFVALIIGSSVIHQLVHYWIFHSILTFQRLAWGSLMVGMFLAFLWAIRLQEVRRKAEIHASKIEKEVEATRLKYVRSHLDSKELLANLHIAGEKVTTDPDGAEELLTKTSEELRIALKNISARIPESTSPRPTHLSPNQSSKATRVILLSLTWLIVGVVMTGARFLDDVYIWKYSELPWNDYWNLWYSWLGVSLLTPFIFWMSRFSPGKKIIFHIAACILFWCLISGTLSLKLYGLQEWRTVLPSVMGNGLAWGFKFDVYGAALITAIALNRLESKRKEDVRLAKIETLLINAQLDALKMQIHPHFLFNALNSIMELIHQNRNQAAELLVRLEQFLRMTLTTEDIQEVPLRKELDFVSCYLEMQKVRFPKRLKVKMEIDESSMDTCVPVLILQPLVENAVRHGIAQNTGPGEISIQSQKRDGMLQLRIRDTGPGISNHEIREGIGLVNTKRRLQQTYGKAFRFEMQNEEMGGLLVSLEIPCH